MSEMGGRRGDPGLGRVATMLKRVAYALAAGGLFAWFILDKPLAGAALLLVAFADGLASLFISRRAASQKTYMEKE